MSKVVVRKWLTQHDIPKRVVGITGRRIYVHYTDVLTLESLHPRTSTGQDLLTLKDAAEHLGIARSTLKRWMAEANLSLCVVGTARQRIYIHRRDVLQLADQHEPMITRRKREENP